MLGMQPIYIMLVRYVYVVTVVIKRLYYMFLLDGVSRPYIKK